MKTWIVRVNQYVWTLKATHSWTAVTRAVKGYYQHRNPNKNAPLDIRVSLFTGTEENQNETRR